MNGAVTAASEYASKFEAFRKSDEERNTLFEDIIKAYEDLKIKYDEQADDYHNEVASRRMLQQRVKELEKSIAQHKQLSTSNNFVLAAIDGDGAIFKESLYAQGGKGGAEAAALLHAAIQNHLKQTYPNANVSDWSIVVLVALNLQGLAATLIKRGEIGTHSTLVEFAREFGQARQLFNIVDVGAGKERADEKIKQTLRLYIPNAQCRHVFFGPTHDNGYLPCLGEYKGDAEIASRLTLIETRPAQQGFINLGLNKITIPKVFRDRDIESTISSSNSNWVTLRRPSTMQHSAPPFVPSFKSTSPTLSVDDDHSSTASAATSWATVGKAPNGTPKTIDLGLGRKKSLTPPKKSIYLNADGERVDNLPKFSAQANVNLDDRMNAAGRKVNLCNKFHLEGFCSAGTACEYQHGKALTPDELIALKHRTRGIYCSSSVYCQNFDCYLGHHCKHGAMCTKGSRCPFEDTHDMDIRPVRRVFEDGSEEDVVLD